VLRVLGLGRPGGKLGSWPWVGQRESSSSERERFVQAWNGEKKGECVVDAIDRLVWDFGAGGRSGSVGRLDWNLPCVLCFFR
jgi:hypothetical protein